MECKDPNCPIHGRIKVRGQTFVGRVVRYKMQKSAIVEWERIVKIPKYERVFRTTSRVVAHVPDCIKVREGDLVRIGETRKISKTKSFVILEVLKSGKEDKGGSKEASN